MRKCRFWFWHKYGPWNITWFGITVGLAHRRCSKCEHVQIIPVP